MNKAVKLVDKNSLFLLSILISSIGFLALNSTIMNISRNASESMGRISNGIEIAMRDQI